MLTNFKNESWDIPCLCKQPCVHCSIWYNPSQYVYNQICWSMRYGLCPAQILPNIYLQILLLQYLCIVFALSESMGVDQAAGDCGGCKEGRG